MSLIKRMRKQDAVWWEVIGIDGSGKPRYAAPVEMKVRWADKTVEFLDGLGNRQISNSVVYVDRVIRSGYMRKGLLADLADVVQPTKNTQTFLVRGYNGTPNLRNTETLHTVML